MSDELIQGGLSQVSARSTAPTHYMDQASGNSMLQTLQEMMQSRTAAMPSMQQRDTSRDAYIEAIRNAGQAKEGPFASLAYGMLRSASGDPMSMMASAGRELADRQKYERDAALKAEIDATKVAYDDTEKRASNPFGLGAGATTALVQSELNPLMNVGGVGAIEKRTGKLVVPANMEPEYEKIKKRHFDYAVTMRAPDPDAWATQAANYEMSELMKSRQIMGGRAEGFTPPPITGQAPVSFPSNVPTPAAPPVTIGGDVSKTKALMKQKMEELAAAGDYEGASALQKEFLRATPEPQAATSQRPAPLARPDLMAEKVKSARDVTMAEEQAKVDVRKGTEMPTDVVAAENVLVGLADFSEQVKNALDDPGLEKASGLRSLIPLYGGASSISGTDPAQFRNKIDELKSRSLLEKLLEIKTLSKTGASGFGALTEQEAVHIMKGIANLDPDKQSPELIRKELGNLQKRIDTLATMVNKNLSAKYPNLPKDVATPSTKEETREVAGKTYVRNPKDGKWYPK